MSAGENGGANARENGGVNAGENGGANAGENGGVLAGENGGVLAGWGTASATRACDSSTPVARSGAARNGTRTFGVELGKSSAQLMLAPTGIRPPHTAQRARKFAPVTLAGSTRKTDWQSGHETFMTRQSR